MSKTCIALNFSLMFSVCLIVILSLSSVKKSFLIATVFWRVSLRYFLALLWFSKMTMMSGSTIRCVGIVFCMYLMMVWYQPATTHCMLQCMERRFQYPSACIVFGLSKKSAKVVLSLTLQVDGEKSK